MKRHPHALQRILVAVAISIVAIPASSTALLLRNEQVTEGGETILEINQRALEDRTKLRRQRRAYWRAIEQYQRTGKSLGIEKPDVNDPASIQKALEAREAEEENEEEGLDVTSLTTDQLSASNRSLLRRYTRARMCPDSLATFPIAGFYELCLAIVGAGAARDPVVGLRNHNQTLYEKLRPASSGLSGFKLRMQMMKEARDSSNRRESVGYSRPEKCFGGFDC